MQGLIEQLAEKGSTPSFSPHITLLGQTKQKIDLFKPQMEEFFKNIEPFDISFSHMGMFDTYYRSIVMHTHPGSVLENMHTRAKSRLQEETRDLFMPHLSLQYSNLTLSEKQALLKDILIQFPLTVRIETAVLIETNGGPDQWQEILRIPLN